MSKKKKRLAAASAAAAIAEKRSRVFHDPPPLQRSAWLDGGNWLVERGVDFHMLTDPEAFATRVRREAALLGLTVHVEVRSDGNVLVVGDPN